MALSSRPPREVSTTLKAVSDSVIENREQAKPERYVEEPNDHLLDDSEDSGTEGLTLLMVGALVNYTNREKIKSKRSIGKAVERVNTGNVKIGTDIPKYIADQLSYLSKQSGLTQKDYILKLVLEDMYRRGVFEEPRAEG